MVHFLSDISKGLPISSSLFLSISIALCCFDYLSSAHALNLISQLCDEERYPRGQKRTMWQGTGENTRVG